MIKNQEIVEELVSQFGENITDIQEPYGMLTFTTNRENIVQIIDFLNKSDKFRFRFLTDVTGIQFPDNKGGELGVIYHLHSFENAVRLRIKVFVPLEDSRVPTMTSLYATANWMERETYDFYGIIFEGHPNLKRILNIDEMDYFPMRKEYALEDSTRQDKIDALFGR